MVNWNDPRNRRRALRTLGWSCAALRTAQKRPVTRDKLQSVFGMSSNPTSAYLRHHLLTPANSGYFNMHSGIAKTWYLNRSGVKHIRGILRDDPRADNSAIDEEAYLYTVDAHHHEIESGEFEYVERSSRCFNNLQFLRTPVRERLFAAYGYVYNYDIRNAAPTILYQFARDHDCETLPGVETYLADPDTYRHRLKQDLHVDLDAAKQLIIARFAGASLGIGNSLAAVFNHNALTYSRLVNNVWFQDISEECRVLWRALKPYYSPHARFTARLKWQVYFAEERRIMRCIERYLTRTRTRRYFLEHDGWRTDLPVDLIGLSKEIKNKTGYVIDFSENVIE